MHNYCVKQQKYSIYINNEKKTHRETGKILKSVQDIKILKFRGGFLFKSSINEHEFHLGIVPVMIEGERTHHYDIKLDYEDDYIFSGFFNVDGTLGMLFTPPGKKEDITDDFKAGLKKAYAETVNVLVESGLSKEIKLDWISIKMLEEAGLFQPVPQKLIDFTHIINATQDL